MVMHDADHDFVAGMLARLQFFKMKGCPLLAKVISI